MNGVSVVIDERGPARVSLTEKHLCGRRIAHDSGDPFLAEACELAWSQLARAGRRLPAGTVEVVVFEDEFHRLPSGADVGRAIARAA